MRATYFVFLPCVVVISAVASAQAIQKWKTPAGKLYFGDNPPAGSTKIGEEGSNEPPANGSSQEGAPRSAEKERFSIDVSRERTEIEKALNNNAERLEEVDKQITEVQRSPNVVPPWMDDCQRSRSILADPSGRSLLDEATEILLMSQLLD